MNICGGRFARSNFYKEIEFLNYSFIHSHYSFIGHSLKHLSLARSSAYP